MPTKIGTGGGQQGVGQTRRASEPVAVGDLRTKKHHLIDIRPIGSRDGVKVDHQEPPKAAKDKVRRFLRGSFRMTDTREKLKNRGALTPEEERWLLDLKQNNRAAYNKLGKLMTVRKFLGMRGQHGLLYKQDRDKVRMQTLKAAVHEAVKTAESDKTGTAAEQQSKKKQTVARALDAATKVRGRMNRDDDGVKLRLYKFVTPDTLRDPRPFYDKCERIVRNSDLAYVLTWQTHILHKIKDVHLVVKAAQALVDHDLLDGAAAKRLLWKLVNKPDQVNELMAAVKDVTGDGMVPAALEADRQKVRSLLLLSFAYTTHNNALNKGVDLCAEVDADELSGSDGKGRTSQNYNADDWALRQAHDLIPALPHNGTAPDGHRETWITWAKQAANPRMKLLKNGDKKEDIKDNNKDNIKYSNKADKKSDKKAGKRTGKKTDKKAESDPIIRINANGRLAEDLRGLLDKNARFTDENPDYRIANPDDVVRAFQPLLDNNLLDPGAARRLRQRLQEPSWPDDAVIRYIASVTGDEASELTPAERQKAASLLYLGFAYMTDETFDYFRDRAKDEFDVNPSVSDLRGVLKHTFKSLPDLPASGDVDGDEAKAWLSWWGIGPGPAENDPDLDDDIKVDHEAKRDIP